MGMGKILYPSDNNNNNNINEFNLMPRNILCGFGPRERSYLVMATEMMTASNAWQAKMAKRGTGGEKRERERDRKKSVNAKTALRAKSRRRSSHNHALS